MVLPRELLEIEHQIRMLTFDEEEIAEVSEHFHVLVKLGEGTYGKVYKARSRTTNEVFALKRIRIAMDEEGVPATAVREVSLLNECDHPNVIRLHEVLCSDEALYLVFEFMDMDLRAFLKRNGPFRDPGALKNAVWQCIQGTNYCHINRILHRDLKPQNVLVDVAGKIFKLADFGLARAFSVPTRNYTHEVVTLWYRAPEILLGERQYATPADIWSLGCIVAEMASAQVLFPGDSQIDTLFKIFRLLGTPSEQVWPGVSSLREFTQEFPRWPCTGLPDLLAKGPALGSHGLDLVNQCLRYNVKTRASARQLLQHSFFKDSTPMEREGRPSLLEHVGCQHLSPEVALCNPSMAETVATIDFDESWGKVLQMYLESQSADDYAIFDRNGRLIPLLEMGNKFIPKPEDFPLTVARKALFRQHRRM